MSLILVYLCYELKKLNKMEVDKIVANIRRRSAELICEEILINGCAKAADNNACKEKVKKELGVGLEENGSGYLVFANDK